MIVIELTNGFYIEVDPMCYTLKKRRFAKKRNSEERQETVTVYGYFSTLGNAVKKFLFLRNLDEHDGAAVSMVEYVRLIDNSNQEAVNIIRDEWNRKTGDVQ